MLKLPGIPDQESKMPREVLGPCWILDFGCGGAAKYIKAPRSPADFFKYSGPTLPPKILRDVWASFKVI